MNVAIYEFGSFRLDLHERVLLRDGVIVPVQRKAFETLALLVQQHGHVVAKDEFWRTIWAESYVEEGSLTVNISILRKVLGDDQNGQRFIETVPRRGYRFVAPVRVIAMPARALADAAVPAPFPVLSATVPVPPTALPVPRRLSLRRWLLLTGVVVGLVVALVYWRWPIAPRTIAVLPFANQKPDVETNFLGYALANVIAAKLSSVHTPQLLPLSTVYRPTNQTPDPQLASGQLNVDLLLHGTYLREDGKLRITAILSEIPSRHVVWQETFDLADEKLMQLQEDVARQICTALQLTLSDEQQKLMALDVSRDPVAYEYYLRGIAWYAQERLQDAIPLLEKSVALDKSFARAWEYLGSSYAVQASTHFGGQSDIEKAQQAFAEAIRLNPREPRPRLFQADLLIETNRVEQALPVQEVPFA
ncbi:MAG: winged helix-turn-helix domain-containing protein [Blastocatellia bacterium]